MAFPELQVGSVVGHRYRIERPLGRGWIGFAFESVDLLNGACRVALKVLRAGDRGSEQDGGLRRQFSVLSGLRHPGLVRILDYGIHKDPAHAYLVEELVSGRDLLVWTEGAAGRQIIPLLTELCRALKYLHRQNIIHGDIKPANVLVGCRDGEDAAPSLKLLDFGLVQVSCGYRPLPSARSLAYLAPEIILGQPPSPRSDLYSLGILAYQLFTRRLPFEDEDREYLVQKHLHGVPDMRPIEQLESGPGLAQVLRSLLEKSPEERPSTPEEVIRLLSAASGQRHPMDVSLPAELYFSASRFVGRDCELKTLQETAALVNSTGRGATIFITGEAGLGKTRLLEEFRVWAAMEGWRVLEATCLAGEGQSYEPYRDLLGQLDRVAGGTRSDSEELFRWPKLPRPMETGPLDRATESTASRFRDQLTRLLVKRLAETPTVLFLHDFHWADDATAAVLDYLMSDIANHAIVACVSLRPVEKEQGPLARLVRQAERQERAVPITLDPLPQEAVTQMIVSMTGSADLGRMLGRWLHASSGGNPYFTEEILKHLVDRGVLRQESGQWLLVQGGLSGLAVPRGAAWVLKHRLDQLSAGASEVARWIALYGRPLATDLLIKLTSLRPDDVRTSLEELVSRHVIRVFQEEGAQVCEPRHSMISEVFQGRLTRRARRAMHRKVAGVLELFCSPEGRVQELAYHYTEGECGTKATEHAMKAAALCRAEFAHEAALRYFEYVLAHPDGLSREALCGLTVDAAEVCCALGTPKRAVRLLERQRAALGRGRGRVLVRARLSLSLSRCYQFMGDVALSWRSATQGLRVLTRSAPDRGVQSLRCELLAQRAFCLLARSETRQALQLARQSLLLARELGDESLFGHLQVLVSGICCVACDFAAGRRSAETAIGSLKSADGVGLLPIAYSHLGINLAALGKLARAEQQHDRAVELARKTRSVVLQALAMCNLAECYSRSGRFTDAICLSREMLHIAGGIQNPHLAIAGQLCLAESQLMSGDFQGAGEILQSLARCHWPTLPAYSRAQAKLLSAWLKLELGLVAEARRELSVAASPHGAGRAYERALGDILRARALHLQGETESAIAGLSQLCKRLLRAGWAYHLCLARLWLAEFHLTLGGRDKALRHGRDALRLSMRMPAKHLEAAAHLVLGKACHPRLPHPLARGAVDAERCRMELESAAHLAQKEDLAGIRWRVGVQLALLDESLENAEASVAHAKNALAILRSAESKIPVEHLECFRKMPETSDAREVCERIVYGPQARSATEQVRLVDLENDQVRALLKTSMRLNGLSDTGMILEAISSLLTELTDFDRAVVILDREAGLGAGVVCGMGKGGRSFQTVEPEVHAIASDVIRNVRPYLMPDGRAGIRWPDSRHPVPSAARSVICGPLRSRGRALGAIYLDSKNAAGDLPESFISFFATFSNIAATALDNSLAHESLVGAKAQLEGDGARAEEGPIEFLGESLAVRQLRNRISAIARSPLDVLICGETGTGKELVARMIHRIGHPQSASFVAVDCGSLSPSLFESELFGYRKGAFTGATENRSGLLESAAGGILFLDEISNLPPGLQAKFLRVLQEREFRRVGETVPRKVDVRIVAATNVDLGKEMSRGRFRRDLYFRLRVAEIVVPPLRERKEDIPQLVEWFLGRTIQSHGVTKIFTSEALRALAAHSYPGNVRELRFLVESSYYAAPGRTIDVSHLHSDVTDAAGRHGADCPRSAREIFELIRGEKGSFEELVKLPFLKRSLTSQTVRDVISLALTAANGRYRKAFRLLGIAEKHYSVVMLFLKRHHCYVDFRPFRK